jgi:hypothetical protein
MGEVDTARQILTERRRQIGKKGYGPEHDDLHVSGELLMAALAYLSSPGELLWPWDKESFHQGTDPIRNIVVAGSFLAAEGDRLIRRRIAGLPVTSGLVILGDDPDQIVDSVDDLRRINVEMKALADS